jgi:signal transduction histidine kinase
MSGLSQIENQGLKTGGSPRRFWSVAAVRWLLSLVSVAGAVILARVLDYYWQSTPFTSLLICAILISAWVGGFGPGLLAVALSVPAFAYYFLPPTFSFVVGWNAMPRLVLFGAAALMVALLAASQRSITESLRRMRDNLAANVQELKTVNEALHTENAERKLAEEKLQQSEAYLAEAQRLTHTGSWAWNVVRLENVFWSDEHFRIFDMNPDEDNPAYEKASEMIHPDDRAGFQQKLGAALLEKRDFEADFRIVLRDGSMKYIHTIGHPMLDGAGNVAELVGTAMDVTERRQAETALREAQANLARVTRVTTMGELTASIAHEVNQPLTAVVNNANACISLLPNDAPNLEEVRQALTEIIEDADRASAVIARIRQLAKNAPVERNLLDLRDVVTDAMVLAKHESVTRRVTIRTELPEELPLVSGDRVQLQQVLLNLVVNGMDAMNAVEESQRVLIICVRSEALDGMPAALLSVQDAGIGFKPEEMNRLFEAFYTTKSQGMGMGLAISRSIIEAHGGRLWAEPNQGPGATFLFSLRAAPKRCGEGGPEANSPSSS